MIKIWRVRRRKGEKIILLSAFYLFCFCAVSPGLLAAAPVDLSHTFLKETSEESLFKTNWFDDSCEKVRGLSREEKHKFAEYAASRVRGKDSQARALSFLVQGCVGEYSSAFRPALKDLLLERDEYTLRAALNGLADLDCAGYDEEIYNRVLELIKGGFELPEAAREILVCVAPGADAIRNVVFLSTSARKQLASGFERRNSSRLLLPVYPFNGSWITPVTIDIDHAAYVGAEWLVVGEKGSIYSRIKERDREFKGIDCDFLDRGSQVYKLEIATDAIGVPIFAYGPLAAGERVTVQVEAGAQPPAESREKNAGLISRRLLTEYGVSADIDYSMSPAKRRELSLGRAPLGQMLMFSSGTVVFQWEQMNSSGTFRKCVRIIDAAGRVSGCNDVDAFFDAQLGEYLFYHISSQDIGLNIYAAITVNEPWAHEKGVLWGPERRIFKADGDILPWENFDSKLNPKCAEAL